MNNHDTYNGVPLPTCSAALHSVKNACLMRESKKDIISQYVRECLQSPSNHISQHDSTVVMVARVNLGHNLQGSTNYLKLKSDNQIRKHSLVESGTTVSVEQELQLA